jgi:hypothetical protein
MKPTAANEASETCKSIVDVFLNRLDSVESVLPFEHNQHWKIDSPSCDATTPRTTASSARVASPSAATSTSSACRKTCARYSYA